MEPEEDPEWQTNAVWRKNSKAGGTILLNSRLFREAGAIRTVGVRRADQRHRVESPETNPRTGGPQIYELGAAIAR